MIKKKLDEATLADAVDGKVETEDSGTVTVDAETKQDIKKADAVLENPDVYSGEGDIEKALDRSLVVAKRNIKSGRGDYPNLLFIGNAGTGKTGRIKSWARKNYVNLVTVSAATMDDTDLGGALAPDLGKGVAQKLASTQFDELGTTPDSILFLDEWNRAPSSVRGTLLTLIQDHTVPDPRVPGAQRFLPNFLFTVAAINPYSVDYDTNKLDDAELGRVRTINIRSDKFNTLGYIKHVWGKQIAQAENADEKRELEGQLALADKLLHDKRFTFDDQVDITKSHEAADQDAGNGLVLNARSFTNLLAYCDGTKKDLINLWNDYCNSNKKQVVIDILSDYEDVADKANDALAQGTDSEVFASKQDRINSIRSQILDKAAKLRK